LKRIGFSLAEHGIEIINCRGKDSIPLFWRLFSAYGYACYIIFDGDSKTNENSTLFSGILSINSWETSNDKYVMTSKYAYFGADFEKYLQSVMPEYHDIERLVSEKYCVTSKPAKAKAVAQHCTEIPDFFIKLCDNLELIEMLH